METKVGAAPSVSNVAAALRPGTALIDITYDLEGDDLSSVLVKLEASSDGGATYEVPVDTASGEVGVGVVPGLGKAIVWNAGADWGGKYSTQMRFRVVAEKELAEVSGKTFTMGATSGDTDSNAPPTSVTVSSFLIQKTETTKRLWDKVRDWAVINGYPDLPPGAGKAPNHPVQSVNWWDVVKWCNARSEREGLSPCYRVSGMVYRSGEFTPDCDWSANGYRLPTEAEWERAARGAISGSRFPWGSDINHSYSNFQNSGGEAYQEGTTGYHPTFNDGVTPFTCPVGSFSSHGFGLSEMIGNVWEWCWDWDSPTAYLSSAGTTNPTGPASGTDRVRRGGAWTSFAVGQRISNRSSTAPSSATNAIGFRSVRTLTFGDFVRIPAGSVTLGVNPGDPETDAPTTSVFVDTFYLQKTETTKAQWDAVRTWALANGYTDLEAADGKAPEHPVHSVRWIEVVKWCNARSEMEGLHPCYYVGVNVLRTGESLPEVDWSANGYRLPTEAEWEKAARGEAEGKRFPWGTDSITHVEANYRSTTEHAYDISPTRGTHPTWTDASSVFSSPVGSFAPNAFGLYDMCGNMWEWCWDRYGSTHYSTIAGTWNPRGPNTGTNRVLRGGSWNRNAAYSRNGYRLSHGATSSTGSDGGFRPARSRIEDNFLMIESGRFRRGRITLDSDLDADPGNVTISGFEMEATETTKIQWDLVRTWALGNGYSDLAAGAGKFPDHPVQSVTWFDAVKWCNARSELEGLTPCYSVSGEVMRTGSAAPVCDWTADGYRLPTEAEWEKASRGGEENLRFPNGLSINHTRANFRNSGGESYANGTTGYHPTHDDGTLPYTSPVESFYGNGAELRNMAGNVAEFCWDYYNSSYYGTSIGATDPRGPAHGSDRVVRGGGWSSAARVCKSSFRSFSDPTVADTNSGFRTVRLPGSIGFNLSDLTLDTRSDEASLSSLALSEGDLEPAFDPATDDFAASVTNAVTALTVTPTSTEPNAVIQVKINEGDYADVSSGDASGSLPLLVGENVLMILVTAQDTTTTKTYTITVNRDKASQTISFAAIGDQLANASIDLSATGGGSGNPVTFSVNTPGHLSGNTLTFTGVGSVTITANQAGNANYHAAEPVSHTFTVTKATATVNLSGLDQVYNGNPRIVSATTNPMGLSVDLTYAGSESPPTSAGTYEVIGTIVSEIYQGSKTANLVVSRAGQTISFPPIIDQLGTASVQLTATGGDSGEPIVFTVASGPAMIGAGNILTFTGAGTVQIRISQAGDANFDPADNVTHTFEVVLPQPDVAVGLSLQNLKGSLIYGSPSSQRITLVSRKARVVTGYASLANRTLLSDRRAADQLAVKATPGNRFFRVSYFVAEGVATAAIVSGSYRTPAMDGTDALRWVTVRISPSRSRFAIKKDRRTVYLRKAFTATLRASSTLYPPASDAGSIRVLTR
ncbi:MAG: SUMF1/EgtB/PvdO family nonheme iron enzyme [Verrucomicrobiae bacterium]|nr:SUMF1/EgtB/PvdO family nonheme iron enzyme [Verrucomicrobiae bacterium]